MTVAQQARAHCEARWDLMGRKGWQGTVVSRQQYIARNVPHAMRNIRDGWRVPAGDGTYMDGPAAEL